MLDELLDRELCGEEREREVAVRRKAIDEGAECVWRRSARTSGKDSKWRSR